MINAKVLRLKFSKILKKWCEIQAAPYGKDHDKGGQMVLWESVDDTHSLDWSKGGIQENFFPRLQCLHSLEG